MRCNGISHLRCVPRSTRRKVQQTEHNLNNRAPSISIIAPTYNSAKTLTSCLESIKNQDYGGDIEIIIADGGSSDNTLEIAQKYTDKIYPNPLKTGEAGKAAGVKHAKNEIIALIDSDNILPSRDWLSRMKNFKKGLSKTVAPLYFADTYAHRHTWIPHKARCRFCAIPLCPKGA